MEQLNRKQMAKQMQSLAKENAELKRFIKDEATAKGDVLRMYATMRIAIVEAVGEEVLAQVLKKLRELTDCESTMHHEEAASVFGDDYESPLVKSTEGDMLK